MGASLLASLLAFDAAGNQFSTQRRLHVIQGSTVAGCKCFLTNVQLSSERFILFIYALAINTINLLVLSIQKAAHFAS